MERNLATAKINNVQTQQFHPWGFTPHVLLGGRYDTLLKCDQRHPKCLLALTLLAKVAKAVQGIVERKRQL